MKVMGPLHCFYLIIVMLSVDINVAQDSQGQCSVAKRYRVRDELQRSTKSRNISVSAVSEGAEIEPKCFCISVTFCRKGCFCRKAFFLQKYSLSAEMLLYFCRKLSAQKISAETNLSAETYLFLQKQPSFCRNQLLSAERHIFLSLSAFGRNFLLSVFSLSVSAVTVSVDL